MSLSDDRIALEALDMVHNQGLTQRDVRDKYGVSRSAVAGFFYRDREAAEQDTNPARKKINRDGGEPDRWWEAGLRARDAR